MLWNMPFMKKTNADFIDWILNQHNGLYYGRECSLRLQSASMGSSNCWACSYMGVRGMSNDMLGVLCAQGTCTST